ncbi:MAG: glycine--tRNA ligase [Planctomycetota bacterium]
MPALSLEQVRNLCMRRGFVFPGSAAYGGLGSFWDYGPLGVEMLNNIKQAWWHDAVYERDDMEGVDAAILMSRKVWQHSGHEATFSDPLVDNKKNGKRYRLDHLLEAQTHEVRAALYESTGTSELTSLIVNLMGNASACPMLMHTAQVLDPATGDVGQWTEPRRFNLMFKSHVGPVEAAAGTDEESAARVYMRPETAQGIFMNFAHVQRSMARKVPFGIAQIGKAFRNEITPGNFIFRTREFEQMEIEFFIKPEQYVQEGEKTDEQWHQEWIDRRFHWWLKLATPPSAGNQEMEEIEQRFRKRAQTADELAHYAKATTDIEYLFPGSLGWGEIEGVANRTDFDLTAHSKDIPAEDLQRLKLKDNKDSNEKFDYFDPDAKKRYVPWVIEPSAGVTRAMLTFLCEAYDEEFVKEPSKQDIDQIKSDAAMIKNNAEKKIKQAEKDIAAGKEAKHDPVQVREFLDKLEDVVTRLPESLSEVLLTLDHPGAQHLEPVKKFRPPTEKFMDEISRTVLRLHPRLAPIKLAVFPLKKNNAGLVELAQKIQRTFQKRFRTIYDDSAGIGKLYRRQDEIGTPYCITVDFESLEDGTVTVRERDTMSQERVHVDALHDYLLPRLELG